MSKGLRIAGVVVLLAALVGIGLMSRASSTPVAPAPKPSEPTSRPPTEQSELSLTSTERWRLALPSRFIGNPAVEPDAIFVTTEDAVVAVSHAGKVLWSTSFPETRVYAPRVDADLVFVAGEYVLLAVQRSTGAVMWRFDSGPEKSDRVNRPVVIDGVVVVNTVGGRVVGLDRATGALRWDQKIATESGAQIAAAEGVAVVVGIAEWTAFAVGTGSIVWSGDLALIGTSSPVIAPTVAGALAVVATDEKVLAVGLHDGQLRWEAKADQSELAQVPTVVGDEVLVPDHWGRLTAYRSVDGEVAWRAVGADGIAQWGEPAVVGEHLVALPLSEDGPRIASPEGALALRPPSAGWGVARLPDGGLVVSTWGDGQNYLLVYDLDLGE